MGPLELYEKLTEQGDQVRALKTAKANKVSGQEVKCLYGMEGMADLLE